MTYAGALLGSCCCFGCCKDPRDEIIFFKKMNARVCNLNVSWLGRSVVASARSATYYGQSARGLVRYRGREKGGENVRKKGQGTSNVRPRCERKARGSGAGEDEEISEKEKKVALLGG